MRSTEILFESRAAVLKAEAEAKLLDRQIELERLRQSSDTALLRQALEYLERSVDNYPLGHALSRQSHEAVIAKLKERLK